MPGQNLVERLLSMESGSDASITAKIDRITTELLYHPGSRILRDNAAVRVAQTVDGIITRLENATSK